jgi:hypothetical protein
MLRFSTGLPRVLAAVLSLCLAFATATAVADNGKSNGNGGHGNSDNGNGSGNGSDNGNGNGNGKGNMPPATSAPAPATDNAAPPTPPGQAKKTDPTAAATPPGQAKKAPVSTTSTTPATMPQTTPATGGPPATAEPTPVPPAAAPVIGRWMGVKPADGRVEVKLPGSTGYVSLSAAGSVPSGAVVDARHGTVVLRSAIDSKGGTQSATIRGALFEVRQSERGDGMTDLVLRGGRPKNCPANGPAAIARAASTRRAAPKAKAGSDRLWARDGHGRFRTRGRNSVATVRGTRWSTRETCAGTLTRVMDGAVDVFDLRKNRTVRVRAGHTYLARTTG